MSVAPLPTRSTARGAGIRGPNRLSGTPPSRQAPSASRIARRRWLVAITKRLLPLAALALLASVVLWPELSGQNDHGRLSYRRGGIEAGNGEIVDARYRGVDDRNRPYTMTASSAQQVGPERINLTQPKGDISLESGAWLMLQAKQGVYIQHAGKLDLDGNVVLYRDDGTTMTTSSAAVDLKAGAAAGSEMVHVEGPFGVLDAQGFAITDGGAVIQFSGPGHLIMNQHSK